MKVALSDSQSGLAGADLPRDIEVQVYDQFMNPVENGTVRFIPLAGGLVDGSPSFSDVTTNGLGIASARWTLHSDTTTDSLAATVPNFATTPDTVVFVAFVNPGRADSLAPASALSDTGKVNTFLTNRFTVKVFDSLGNPTPNVPISFSVVSRPLGAQRDSLSVYNVQTNSIGLASTRLHLGTKLGTYQVRAFAASTQPTSILFTGVANQPDSADTLIITKGNDQTGTVAQQLADSIQFKVTDQFGNVNSAVTVNVSALNGSANPSTGTTNSNGLFSTAWTLGQTSGTQRLVASLPSFPAVVSDTVTATANPDAADSLLLVTMRKLPFDSVAAVPGENITFVVEARDQFNNLKPNATVRFAPEFGYNALFESNQLVSDDGGRVSNVVKTDASRSETFFRASIAGIDTLPLHIFHIQYVAKSLRDTVISPGDTVSFRLQLRNTSPNPVTLDTSNTILSFNDGAHSFSAALNGAVTLPANGSDTLRFDSTVVDSNFANTTYTPDLSIKGGAADSLLSGSITLPINSLSIFNVRVTQITASVIKVARGDSFTATMRVRNEGPETVNVDTSQTTLNIPGLAAS
ncbi:hypothetical protein GWO43_24630, partial [candidate division KSB1 bacterium]|nr:hypothetical protein [candidate division KSB1 bacterium]NIS26263.1 hypothetical protein [candidate division KSB1 bacterium]NIT74003.1 hypothetical protein [candidate division KSB1 bacterium]NIU26912.1 hypothetical protein [candidate division KSB1 bacterium]NIU89412.1 hypothetical protein [candidate division KSB1 bacterium]